MTGNAALVSGCGFLEVRDIEGWLEDRLKPARRAAFVSHQTDCFRCALLGADLEVFRAVAKRGPLSSERREFDRTVAIVKAHLRQKLALLHEIPTGWARWRGWSWRYAAGALAASLLLVALALPLLRRGPEPGGRLVLGNVTIEALAFSKPPVVRGGEGTNDLWRRAEAAYTAEDFPAAEKLLAAITERDPENHDALMYRGIALVLSGSSAEAVPVLERARRLAAQQGLSDLGDSYWLGVGAYQQGNLALARVSLQRVRDAGGADAKPAAELLDQLKEK